MKKQVVVIGLGRFGSSLATSLYNIGHDVLAIDTNEERVQSMMGRVTFPVTGNATGFEKTVGSGVRMSGKILKTA